MELTPSFFISLTVLLISIGGLVWALSARIGKAATERDLYELERKLTNMITERDRQSVQSRANLATKEELLALETDMRGEFKELKVEIKTGMKELGDKHQELLVAVTNLAHQVTAQRRPVNG